MVKSWTNQWAMGLGALAICGSAEYALAAVSAQAGAEFRNAVNDRLGVARSSVFQLPMTVQNVESTVLVVPIDQLPMMIEIEPVSVRSPQYQVLAQQADGTLKQVEPGPVRTFRGKVIGFEGSSVCGSILSDGMHMHVVLPGVVDYWIEPLERRFGVTARGWYAGYHDDDVLSSGGECATDAEQMQIELPGDIPEMGLLGGSDNCLAELACDADYEFFQTWGSIGEVEDRINDIINAVNLQYESEVTISHEITAIIVRTAEPDPYTETLASALLDEFRSHWNANHDNIQRDVAHLFSGKELNGTTIGIAWVSAVCTSFAYGLVESDFSGNFACVTDVSAHELGHNWGASHCSCPSYTMNPSASCANQFDPVESIPEIVAFRDSRLCLEPCDKTGPLACGDPGAGDCYVAHATSSCNDADCCNAVCAVDPDCCAVEWDPFCATQAAGICDSGTPADASLVGYNITIGDLLDGDLASLDSSDEDHLRVTSAINNGQPMARVIVTAESPYSNVSQLVLTAETSANKNDIKTSIALFNFNQQKWVKLTSFDQPLDDTITTIDVPSPNKFVDDATGEVRVRIAQKRNADEHFRCRVDHVGVAVTP